VAVGVGLFDAVGLGDGFARPLNRTSAIAPSRTSRTIRVMRVNRRTAGRLTEADERFATLSSDPGSEAL
jgi:hypothetical protein